MAFCFGPLYPEDLRHARSRHRCRHPYRNRQLPGFPIVHPGSRSRRCGDPRPARTDRPRPGTAGRSDPRPDPYRRRRPEPRAPGRDQGRPAGQRTGDDHQQGLRLRPQGPAPGDPGDPLRRRRGDHRRRPGKHEPGTLRHARRPHRPAHGPRQDGRQHDQRRPVGCLQRLPHGHHRREPGGEVRPQPRATGHLRRRIAAQGRRSHRGRPLQGGDHPGADPAAQGRARGLRHR
ncbi:hypothetical protein D3C81_1035470 [compost metagenome]